MDSCRHGHPDDLNIKYKTIRPPPDGASRTHEPRMAQASSHCEDPILPRFLHSAHCLITEWRRTIPLCQPRSDSSPHAPRRTSSPHRGRADARKTIDSPMYFFSMATTMHTYFPPHAYTLLEPACCCNWIADTATPATLQSRRLTWRGPDPCVRSSRRSPLSRPRPRTLAPTLERRQLKTRPRNAQPYSACLHHMRRPPFTCHDESFTLHPGAR